MKYLSTLFFSIFALGLFSCSSDDDSPRDYNNSIAELLTSHELWYVEPDQPSSDIEFAQNAIAFSFDNSNVYALYNLVGFDVQADGENIGSFSVAQKGSNAELIINEQNFRVYGVSGNTIRIVDTYDNDAFYLTGYSRANFWREEILYERMPHFFNEYEAWHKIETENPEDTISDFMAVNYLRFSPVRNFESSTDTQGLTNENINWNAQGSYNSSRLTEEDELTNELVFIYPAENEGEDPVLDTLQVRTLNDTTIEITEPDLNTTYIYEGSVNIPF